MKATNSPPPRGSLLVISTLFGAWMLGAGGARLAPATEWLSGAALRRQMEQPVSVVYAATPLRRALIDLARTQRVAVLLDRRVDPGQKLTLALEAIPLDQAFRAIAHKQGIEVSRLGPVCYFGPSKTARRLRTLATLRREDARRLPLAVRQRLLRAHGLQWDDFATPRQLVDAWSRKSGLEIEGKDRIPHDLWAAIDLPPLPLIDHLTLLAAQFDLTFTFSGDGQRVSLAPIPDDMALTRRYPGGMDPASLAQKWARLVPDARVHVDGGQIVVRGLLEAHERLTAGETSSRDKPASRDRHDALERQRFTLTVARQPLGQVLKQLADRLKLDLQIDHASIQQAGISLERSVSFQVREASIDKLLRAVLEPSGLIFLREGNRVEVRAKN